MYDSNKVADRIKQRCRDKKITVKKLLEDVGLGFNTMSNMKSSMPKADNIAKIADYLDCSVDYLLGRTDFPEINKGNIEKVDFSILPAETIYKLIAFGGKNSEAEQPPVEPKTT